MKRPMRHYRSMTKEKAEQMRADYFSRKKKQRELAAEYGIWQGSVSRILSGQTWAK